MSSQTLLDDIINTVNEIVFRAVNALEQGLGEIPADALGFKLSREQQNVTTFQTEDSREQLLAEMKESEIEKGIVQLESLLNATVDKDFDKFEIYTLRNILAVGHQEEDLVPWVQLEHYKGFDFDKIVAAAEGGEAGSEIPRPEEIQLRRRKLQETKKLNAMLKAEEAKNENVLAQLRSLNGKSSTGLTSDDADPGAFAFLAAGSNAAGSSKPSLSQDVQTALTQLPALRALLAQLRDSLQVLPHARYGQEDEDSADAIRRRYLDGQSRRAAERRGVDPEQVPAMTLAGRRVDQDEVQGIKAVLDVFQVESTKTEDDDDDHDQDMGE